jgi:hypothetical protein
MIALGQTSKSSSLAGGSVHSIHKNSRVATEVKLTDAQLSARSSDYD